MQESISIICPVFNEEEVIESFYNELTSVIQGACQKYAVEILFVIDRGQDTTTEIIEKICCKDRRVRALCMSGRFGHQMALVAGIDHTDADIIVMMDSDLQHPPSLIPDMLQQYHNGFDIVAGVRLDDHDKSAMLNFFSREFYKFWNALSGLSLQSGEADFRLISRRVAKVFKNSIREQNQFLRGLFYWVGFPKTTVTFEAGHRGGGESKYNSFRLVRFAINSIMSFSKVPLNYAVFVGLLTSIIAIIGVLWIVYDFLIHNNAPSGWYTITVLVLWFSSLQLFFIGIIGQYIGMIFDEVKKRPLYIVDRKINFD